jgi:hypothetical protein
VHYMIARLLVVHKPLSIEASSKGRTNQSGPLPNSFNTDIKQLTICDNGSADHTDPLSQTTPQTRSNGPRYVVLSVVSGVSGDVSQFAMTG